MTIWIVVEEIESGTFADGTVYNPLSAHTSEDGADKAVEEWKGTTCDESTEGLSHRTDEDGWCKSCRHSVAKTEIGLS